MLQFSITRRTEAAIAELSPSARARIGESEPWGARAAVRRRESLTRSLRLRALRANGTAVATARRRLISEAMPGPYQTPTRTAEGSTGK